jgi:hypothetical protein
MMAGKTVVGVTSPHPPPIRRETMENVTKMFRSLIGTKEDHPSLPVRPVALVKKPVAWLTWWNARGDKSIELHISFKTGGSLLLGKLPNTPYNAALLNEICDTDNKYIPR